MIRYFHIEMMRCRESCFMKIWHLRIHIFVVYLIYHRKKKYFKILLISDFNFFVCHTTASSDLLQTYNFYDIHVHFMNYEPSKSKTNVVILAH